MEIYERMFSIMDEKNIKSVEISSRLGISKGVISNWKKRGTNPPAEYIVPICELLNIDIEYFLTGKFNSLDLTNEEKDLIRNFRMCTDDRKSNIKNITRDAAEASQKYNDYAASNEGKLSDYKIG